MLIVEIDGRDRYPVDTWSEALHTAHDYRNHGHTSIRIEHKRETLIWWRRQAGGWTVKEF